MKYRLTKSQLDKVLKNHVVYIYAGNEQENTHILDDFKKARKPIEKSVLQEGDYSAYIKHNEVTEELLGIKKDFYFTDVILIERKNGLDELANCFSRKKKEDSEGLDSRARLEYEFTKALNSGAKLHLMIEDLNGLQKIYNKDYRSELSSASFLGSLFGFQSKYNLNVDFVDKNMSGRYIYKVIYYAIRDALINNWVQLLEE